MAYVIVSTCAKDGDCIEICAVDCIHPKRDEPDFEMATQLFIHPEECICCGSCLPICTSNSIFCLEELSESQRHFAELNALYYSS